MTNITSPYEYDMSLKIALLIRHMNMRSKIDFHGNFRFVRKFSFLFWNKAWILNFSLIKNNRLPQKGRFEINAKSFERFPEYQQETAEYQRFSLWQVIFYFRKPLFSFKCIIWMYVFADGILLSTFSQSLKTAPPTSWPRICMLRAWLASCSPLSFFHAIHGFLQSLLSILLC